MRAREARAGGGFGGASPQSVKRNASSVWQGASPNTVSPQPFSGSQVTKYIPLTVISLSIISIFIEFTYVLSVCFSP